VILDIARFIERERPYWDELETMLRADPGQGGMAAAQRLHYLYRRVASGLVRAAAGCPGTELHIYLEELTARAYARVHDTRDTHARARPLHWLLSGFPNAFRRQIRAFQLALLVTLAGSVLGAAALLIDAEAKQTIMPFSHLLGSPSERVAMEESTARLGEEGNRQHNTFAAMLMQNNIRVSITAAVLGITFGIGTLALLFYNGVILGAVALDYIRDGQTTFLLGWLLPHGATEIPAILIAGQAGFVLARAIIGHESTAPLRARLRLVGSDIVLLLYGLSILLIWAGIVESFFSQFHEPFLPYAVKITFGVVELVVLIAFLRYAGRNTPKEAIPHA